MAYSADPTLWLYTSLTAGSSHVITATSRLETILKANKIPFRALDVATDEKARMLWGRRSKGRKLPGLVKYGSVIGDMEEIEEWNEYGELKQQLNAADGGLGSAPSASTSAAAPTPAAVVTPSTTDPKLTAPAERQTLSRSASETRHISISEPTDSHDSPAAPAKKEESTLTIAMRQASAEAAARAGQMKAKKATPAAPQKDTEPALTEQNKLPETATLATTEPTVDKAMADPHTATEITAAKTPAQLASEGATKTTVDKVAEESETASETSSSADGTTSSNLAPSNEEQLLQLQRKSSVAKTKSGLSSEIDPEDIEEAKAEEPTGTDEEAGKEAIEEKDEESEKVVVADSPAEKSEETEESEEDEDEDHDDNEEAIDTTAPTEQPAPPMRLHRGGSISDASKEEIAEVERRNTIHEEDEDEDEEDIKAAAAVEPSKEKPKTQDQDPKSSTDASVSVED